MREKRPKEKHRKGAGSRATGTVTGCKVATVRIKSRREMRCDASRRPFPGRASTSLKLSNSTELGRKAIS